MQKGGATRTSDKTVALPYLARLALTVVLVGGTLTASACLSVSDTEKERLTSTADLKTGGAKVLNVAILGEPETPLTTGAMGSSGSGGANNVIPMIQDHLVREDNKGGYYPLLASEQISIEKGTWVLNPDGTMDTTWKLRAGVLWHDGAPFTSEDMLLTFYDYTDPASTSPGSVRPFLVSASAPDPHTFVVRWSTIRSDADRAPPAISGPVPKHRVGDVFLRGDRIAFESHPQFSTEFVGLGPYRIERWERGSHMELARFDAYYQGPPPLARIIVRFMSDPNAMISSILAGAVDVVLPIAVDLDAAVEVRRRWEGVGHHVQFDISSRLPHLELQHRAEYAIPKNGFTILPVRQALYHAIDRALLSEVTTHGIAPIADSWILPSDNLYSGVEASIPRFPYDPQRAQQLLAQAGWVRGPDGVLVHVETREPFRTELWGSPGEAASPEKTLSVIAPQWQAVGVQVELQIVSSVSLRDREYRALHPGPLLATQSSQRLAIDGLHSIQIPTPANRWAGFNRGGYSNPRVDAVLDKLRLTIVPTDRVPVHRELLREQMGDLAVMPLYWEVVPTLMVNGVRGPIFHRQNASWNIMQWAKE